MKKGIICLALFAVTIGSSIGFKLFKVGQKSLDVPEQVVKVKAETVTYTIRQFSDFLENKREHYPLSDEFIERYQQASGGYIDYAKQCGIEVNKYNHSPNQKWHFFDSWLIRSIEDGSLTYEDDAKKRIYTNLQCPELLLWIYEAMGVDPVKVKSAKEVAEAGKVKGDRTSTIAKNMRAVVSWEDLIVEINKQ